MRFIVIGPKPVASCLATEVLVQGGGWMVWNYTFRDTIRVAETDVQEDVIRAAHQAFRHEVFWLAVWRKVHA